MTIYADRPLRRALQLGGDLLALAWIALGVWTAVALHRALAALARPGVLLHDAGDGLASHMASAAEAARNVPFVGDDLAAPLARLEATGDDLSAAGTGLQQTAAEFALLTAVAVAVLAVAVALGAWLPVRLRWIRQASQARQLTRLPGEAGTRLLALRALTAAPVPALCRLHDDPAEAWRSGDERVVAELAALELRRLGLHPARPAPSYRDNQQQ